jgi:hypothetical protein
MTIGTPPNTYPHTHLHTGTILFGDRVEYFGSLPRTASTLFCVVVRTKAVFLIFLSVSVPTCLPGHSFYGADPDKQASKQPLSKPYTQNGDSIKLVLDSVSYVPVVGALYIVVYLCLFAYV